MKAPEILKTCTTICVRNLPNTVDEKFLELYFRSRIDPPKCQVKVFSHFKGDPSKVFAFVNLGNGEKVRQAIREVNGCEIEGERMLISLAMKNFYSSPGKKVYLKRFPDGIQNRDLYDLLSSFGTVVGMEVTYNHAKRRQLFSACVTFLSEDQAQHAIRVINSSRKNERAIVAEADKRLIVNEEESVCCNTAIKTDVVHEDEKPGRVEEFVARLSPPPMGTDSCEECDGSDAAEAMQESHEVVSVGESEASRCAKDDVKADNTTSRDRSALSPQRELTITEEEKKQAVADSLLSQYEKIIMPRRRLEKILQVLRNSLDLDHLMAHCAKKRETFQLYADMAEAALEQGKWTIVQLSAEELNATKEQGMIAKPLDDGILHTIRESLYYEGVGHYPRETLDRVLDLVMQHLDMDTLFALCTDEKQFHRMVFHAKVAIEGNAELILPTLSIAAEELILQLKLDRLSTVAQWKQAIREHLALLLGDQLGSDGTEQFLGGMFHSPLLPKDIYDLLNLATNESRFRLMVFHAKVALERNSSVLQIALSDAATSLATQLHLDKMNTAVEWKQALREHVLQVHEKRYGRDELGNILDKIFGDITLPTAIYRLLEICADLTRFRVYAAIAEFAMENSDTFAYHPISGAVLRMVEELKLGMLKTTSQLKSTLREHLVRMHEAWYGPAQFTKILDDLFGNLIATVDVYKLLYLCADQRTFRRQHPM